MKVDKFVNILDSKFYTGVPDSQLAPLCNYLMNEYGIDSKHHIIGANEGNCVAIAAGYHLATGEIPVVYMQNSGEGNIINPFASLLHEQVYGIPAIFVIGWRGQPGVHDEPQHIFQGEVTVRLLEGMGISSFVIGKETSDQDVISTMEEYKKVLAQGKSVAFVIEKNALTYEKKVMYKNQNTMSREEIIEHIVDFSKEDVIICTTGKASRELFEIRENNKQSHKYDFLTVGSMGHSSSIALGVAIHRPDKKVWCVDGDGAVLMHMGAMAVLGANAPDNLIHIVINNEAHETVGGMPTVASNIDMVEIARGCGYKKAISVRSFKELDSVLEMAKNSDCLWFVEVKCAIGAREDLGRPTTTPLENKQKFMEYLITI